MTTPKEGNESAASIGAPTENGPGMSVDLGLEALLQGYIEPAFSEPKDVPSTPVNLDQFKSVREHIAENRWAEVLTEVEPLMESSGELGSVSKLYWILAHARQKSLPRSFLVAPFEQVKNEIVEGARFEIDELLKVVGDSLGQSIAEKNLAKLPVPDPLENGGGIGGFTPPVFKSHGETVGTVTRLNETLANFKTTRSRSLDYILFALILFTAFGAYWFVHSSGVIATVATAGMSLEVSEDKVALLEPALILKPSVGNLGALYYDVQNSWAAAAATAVPEKISPVVTATLQVAAPIVPATKKDSRSAVNTSGPLEPQEVTRKIRGDRGESASRRDSYPAADMQDRRLPEIPIDRGWYRVMDSTRILSEPGGQARAIGKVARGDEVLVEAQFGKWARLKSPKSGRSGFIDAGVLDSAPIKE